MNRAQATAAGIEYSWQDTPQLWMASRRGLCWCEDCRTKNTYGLGKTMDEARATLIEAEDE